MSLVNLYLRFIILNRSKEETYQIKLVKVIYYPRNIRLDEDVLETSFVLVFRRRLSWPYVFKMSSRRFQDVF